MNKKGEFHENWKENSRVDEGEEEVEMGRIAEWIDHSMLCKYIKMNSTFVNNHNVPIKINT